VRAGFRCRCPPLLLVLGVVVYGGLPFFLLSHSLKTFLLVGWDAGGTLDLFQRPYPLDEPETRVVRIEIGQNVPDDREEVLHGDLVVAEVDNCQAHNTPCFYFEAFGLRPLIEQQGHSYLHSCPLSTAQVLFHLYNNTFFRENNTQI